MIMRTAKTICFWMIFSFASAVLPAAQATTTYYTLENVFLDDGTRMSGTFSWTSEAVTVDGRLYSL